VLPVTAFNGMTAIGGQTVQFQLSSSSQNHSGYATIKRAYQLVSSLDKSHGEGATDDRF
jgi:hypothetical protein